MSRRSKVWITAAFACAAAGVVWAVLPDPAPWASTLRAVTEAPDRFDYRGTVVLTSFHQRRFETRVLLEHRAAGRTRLTLDGWRTGDEAWKEPSTPLAERPEMRVPHRKRILRPILDPEQAARHYAIRALAGETVAGRPARVLSMVPMVTGRPSYRLWIDVALSVPLGFEARDAGGNLIHAWKFVSFQEGAPGVEGAQIAASRPSLTFDELLAKKTGPVWVPHEPPLGFAFHRARLSDSGGVMLAYTDGMNVISLIQRNPEADRWKLSMERSAAGRPVVHRWRWYSTSILKVRLGDTLVTVVGDEPSESLTRMIQTMVEHR